MPIRQQVYCVFLIVYPFGKNASEIHNPTFEHYKRKMFFSHSIFGHRTYPKDFSSFSHGRQKIGTWRYKLPHGKERTRYTSRISLLASSMRSTQSINILYCISQSYKHLSVYSNYYALYSQYINSKVHRYPFLPKRNIHIIEFIKNHTVSCAKSYTFQ